MIERRSTRWMVLAVGAVALLLVGMGIGWLLRGDDATPDPSYVAEGSVVAGAELTDRQAEMVDVARQYVEAFVAGDGETAASFMTPDGYLSMPTLTDQVMHVEDGTFQSWVSDMGLIPDELTEPMTVYDDHVVLTGYLEAMDSDWLMIIGFTDSGDVRIVSDTHWAF